jgi:hypothetical protein
MPTQARNLLWRDFQGVGVKGDTFTRSEFQMLVEGDRPLRFVQIDQYGERLSDGEQRRMTLTAQREPDGTRLPLDWDWLNADALRYWIHFAIPIPPGEQIGFFYEFIWPHTLPNLALGEREVLEWEFVRPTDHFEVKLRLDPKLKRDRPLMATLHGMDQSKLRQFRDGDAWTLELGEDNLPQGHKIVLELDARE